MNDMSFSTIAHYYDALYVRPDMYGAEADAVDRILKRCGRSGGVRLLDVACGTGGHLPFLKDRYEVEGLDLSEDMLRIAREKHPGVPFHLADMTDFRLDAAYDAIICMYGGIGFAGTYDNASRAVASMARHLAPGGVLLLVPWMTKETFHDALVVDAVNRPEIGIARMENVRRKSESVVEVSFHHLIGENGQVRYHTQTMEIGLFSEAEYVSLFRSSGLSLVERYTEPDIMMGAFVGRKD